MNIKLTTKGSSSRKPDQVEVPATLVFTVERRGDFRKLMEQIALLDGQQVPVKIAGFTAQLRVE